MTTTVLLIRHAQTNWNLQRRWQGHLDIPLNEEGRRQALALADRLATWPVTAIYSSDLRRAADTAQAIGLKLGLTPQLDPVWRERHGGDFQGERFDYLQERHGREFYRVRYEGARPPGGESSVELAQRVSKAFDDLLIGYTDETVAVVSHGGALNLLISWILGFPLGKPAPVSLRKNAGLSVVKSDQGQRWLSLLNDTCHLAQV